MCLAKLTKVTIRSNTSTSLSPPWSGGRVFQLKAGFRKQSARCVQILTINLDVEGALLILKQPKASVAYFNQRSLSRHVKED
jgi:hypothetical protein